ncbi:MAG TPA: hypothetical protein VMS98_04685 [Thermoanaerobaculia bacterium]|nr:hypothetical protein [Thermoanaerobaculia bacterium]
MLRKLNFTERTRIPLSATRIVLRRDAAGVLTFDAALDLTAVAAPPDARVYIEAQYRTSYMRFECGTVGEPRVPEERLLTGIDSDRIVRFRVKIVDDQRRVLASSNDVVVSAESGDTGTRISLLPVNFDDLGDQVWRIHFEGGQPVLELNNRIEGIERLARSDPAFFALVYPAAVREVLTRLVLLDGADGEDSGEWPDLWIRWARELVDSALPSGADDRGAWIDDVVVAFCGRHRVADKMRAAEEDA